MLLAAWAAIAATGHDRLHEAGKTPAGHMYWTATSNSALFSEPETALLLALTNSFRQHVWLNMHSGMEALFMPYDHLATIPEGQGPEATLGILNQLNT